MAPALLRWPQPTLVIPLLPCPLSTVLSRPSPPCQTAAAHCLGWPRSTFILFLFCLFYFCSLRFAGLCWAVHLVVSRIHKPWLSHHPLRIRFCCCDTTPLTDSYMRPQLLPPLSTININSNSNSKSIPLPLLHQTGTLCY